MIAGDIPDLPELITTRTLKVHAPSLVVFICGGLCGKPNEKPKSLRDAFLRIHDRTPMAKHKFVLAEEVEVYFPKGAYQELLRFEADIAQLAELLMLFSESAGSLAELGAFVMDDEVAPRMMVVIDDDNFQKDSFIKLGPLYSLTLHYGEESVCVLGLQDLNLKNVSNVDEIDLDKFRDSLEAPLKTRLARKREPRSFDSARHGHITKLITGLIQHYSALTLEEISVLLFCLGVSRTEIQIKQHLQCAEIFGWIIEQKRGLVTYYAAIASKSALHFEFAADARLLDRARWRADIREYWREREPARFKTISEAAVRSL